MRLDRSASVSLIIFTSTPCDRDQGMKLGSVKSHCVPHRIERYRKKGPFARMKSEIAASVNRDNPNVRSTMLGNSFQTYVIDF